MVEISLVLDNGKVYTIRSNEIRELLIKQYDLALDLEYAKVVFCGDRVDISDVFLMDKLLYEKDHRIKEVIIGEEHFNNEDKGYIYQCTIDDSRNIVIEILNEDTYFNEFTCKSDPMQLEYVMKEHIELVALIESVVKKLVFIDKEIDFEKVIALCSIYDFLTSIDYINMIGFSYYINEMFIHKYYKQTPKGISNGRIEEILAKKCLFKYGFQVTDTEVKNAIKIITEQFTGYSLENMINIINTYENLFVLGEKIEWDDEEELTESETESETEETIDKELKLSDEILDLFEDISDVHYSGSADGYDCFE